MGWWLPKLKQHGEFRKQTYRLNDDTRAQLLAISDTTIARLLKPTRGGMQLSGDKPGRRCGSSNPVPTSPKPPPIFIGAGEGKILEAVTPLAPMI